jgi:hypothetical protein
MDITALQDYRIAESKGDKGRGKYLLSAVL